MPTGWAVATNNFKPEATDFSKGVFLMSGLKEWQKLAIAFIASYIILYALQALLSGNGIMAAWNSGNYWIPTFYIMPIVGFFFAYYATEWAEEYFETKYAKHPAMLVLFIIAALLAWHIALTFYFQNNVALSLESNQQYINGDAVQFSETCKIAALEGGKRNAFLDSFGIAGCLAGESDWSQLNNNPYLIFIIAAAFGWTANWVLSEKRKKHHSN